MRGSGPDDAIQPGQTRRSILSVGFGARTGAAAGIAAQRTGLVHGVVEVVVAVAQCHATLALRDAAVGFAVDPAIDGDEPVARAFDLDLPIDQDLAAAVERDEVGGTIALSVHVVIGITATREPAQAAAEKPRTRH